MRRFLAAVFLFIPFWGKTQVKFGVKGGINSSSIRFYDFHPPRRDLIRPNLGMIIEIPLEENWSIHTGSFYSGKGVRHTRTPSTNRIDSFTVLLNYIEIPLNVAYKFNPERANGFVITAGAYLAYGFNGKIQTINSNRPPTSRLHKKETDQYKRLDMGFSLGSVYQLNDQWAIHLDYSRSISNIQRVGKEKNRVVRLSLCWYLSNNKSEDD
jgi:outer membrane immunogenic protein